jgi:hypothetical protein
VTFPDRAYSAYQPYGLSREILLDAMEMELGLATPQFDELLALLIRADHIEGRVNHYARFVGPEWWKSALPADEAERVATAKRDRQSENSAPAGYLPPLKPAP